VVWREVHRGNGSEPVGVPHGVEFIDINHTNLDNLRRILQSREFGSKNTH
jgi:hypothetical protein